MTLPHSPFAALTSPQMSFLDDVFANLGGMAVTACTAAGSANAITLTAITGQANTGINSYQQDLLYGFVAAATNSGDTTAAVGALAVIHIYKNTITGPALLTGSEIAINNFHILAYDAALGGGVGGFHLANPASPLLGTLTAPTTRKFISGSGTYTPPAGVLYISVLMLGGGGGGGGCGISAASVGGNGGDTTFGSFTAGGGKGGGTGTASVIGVGGAGGTVSGTVDIGVNGTGGAGGTNAGTLAEQPGGIAGASPLGGAMFSGQGNTGAGTTGATNSGSGGSGGSGVQGNCFPAGGGGAGAYILTTVTNPIAVSYGVGAGGTAGNAGSGGNAGGAGAAGIIYVREFYQ